MNGDEPGETKRDSGRQPSQELHIRMNGDEVKEGEGFQCIGPEESQKYRLWIP